MSPLLNTQKFYLLTEELYLRIQELTEQFAEFAETLDRFNEIFTRFQSEFILHLMATSKYAEQISTETSGENLSHLVQSPFPMMANEMENPIPLSPLHSEGSFELPVEEDLFPLDLYDKMNLPHSRQFV